MRYTIVVRDGTIFPEQPALLLRYPAILVSDGHGWPSTAWFQWHPHSLSQLSWVTNTITDPSQNRAMDSDMALNSSLSWDGQMAFFSRICDFITMHPKEWTTLSRWGSHHTKLPPHLDKWFFSLSMTFVSRKKHPGVMTHTAQRSVRTHSKCKKL